MTPAMTVRQATSDDTDAIRAVARAANAEFAVVMGEPLFGGYLADVLDVEHRRRTGTLLVAEGDGQVLGTITVYADIHDEGMPVAFPAGTAGIRATAVDPAARGQGIGALLVEAAVARARAAGARRIALHTADFMTAATRLYERCGFRRVPAHDYVANTFFGAVDGRRLDARAFVRPLDGDQG